jgi:hypothetical protein
MSTSLLRTALAPRFLITNEALKPSKNIWIVFIHRYNAVIRKSELGQRKKLNYFRRKLNSGSTGGASPFLAIDTHCEDEAFATTQIAKRVIYAPKAIII